MLSRMPPRYKLEFFAAITWVVGIATFIALVLLVAYTVWSFVSALWSR